MSSTRSSPIRRLQLFQNGQNNSPDLILAQQNQRLSVQLHTKNLQLQQVYRQNKLIKIKYEDQLSSYQRTLSLMQKQLKQSQKCRENQFKIIKQRYEKMSVQQSENMKNYHEHQIQFLLKEIANLRADSSIRQQKLALKQSQLNNMKQSFERQIQDQVHEINTLTKKTLIIEQSKNKQLKQLSSKHQLEKSRTSNLVSSRKENTNFLDKQLRKLNEQILDKSIKIESLQRENNKLKKKYEENQKKYLKKIQDIVKQREDESKQRQAYFIKVEKTLREEIMQYKGKQVKLLGQLDSMNSQIQLLNNQMKNMQVTIKEKQSEIGEYKSLLERQRQDHASQISRLLKQRKKRSSNMGSSRSLASSVRDSQQLTTDNHNIMGLALKKMDSVRLPIVKQQSPDKSPSKSLQNSQISNQQQQDNQFSRAILHYDALIEELKRSHASEIQLLKHKINKLSKNYQDKQQQVLDILTRFSPLLKIHTEEKSVEQDRKQRIQRHWKADLTLLEVMIHKYKIKVFGG